MIAWPAKVLAHVGEYAVIQVPGGLLSIWDRAGLLINGDSTTVTAFPADVVTRQEEFTNSLFTEPLQAFADGQVSLLISNSQRIPLLLRPGEQLPSDIILSISTQPAELDEGTPVCTGLPPEPPAPDPCGCDQSPLFTAC